MKKKLTGLLLLVALASSLNADKITDKVIDKIDRCSYYHDAYLKILHSINVNEYSDTKLSYAVKDCLDYNLKAEEFCNDIDNESLSKKISNDLKKDRVVLINMINALGGF